MRVLPFAFFVVMLGVINGSGNYFPAVSAEISYCGKTDNKMCFYNVNKRKSWFLKNKEDPGAAGEDDRAHGPADASSHENTPLRKTEPPKAKPEAPPKNKLVNGSPPDTAGHSREEPVVSTSSKPLTGATQQRVEESNDSHPNSPVVKTKEYQDPHLQQEVHGSSDHSTLAAKDSEQSERIDDKNNEQDNKFSSTEIEDENKITQETQNSEVKDKEQLPIITTTFPSTIVTESKSDVASVDITTPMCVCFVFFFFVLFLTFNEL